MHAVLWWVVQNLLEMDMVWEGDFKLPKILAAESKVMNYKEEMVMVDQRVEVYDMEKMEIMGLDPVIGMVMVGVKVSIL